MKKITTIIAAVASVMLAGCAKEQFVAPSAYVLSVSIDNEDKTTIGDLNEGKRPIYWDNGDQISVNGVASDKLSGIGEEATKADFTFQTEVSAPYNTLYPASYYKNASTVTLPAVAGALPVPMAAQGLALKPLTGVLKITVNAKAGADPVNLIQVEVSSATTQLSGDFTINYSESTITGADASSKTVTLKKNRVLDAENPYEVFIPVPAGTYDFSVKVLDGNGQYMVQSTTSAKTIKAGQVSALAAFEYDPTGTQEATVEITSAEELVAFAKKSNAGDYDSQPWPIAKLMNDITFDATTSKALRDEDGIGVPEDAEKGRTTDQYFNGIFDGQGYKIKGYISQETVAGVSGDSLIMRPIFNYTGSDSFIRNIIIDESCDLQLPKGGFGSLAYRVKGVVENITCNAKITVNFVAGAANIGGIVGRVYGGTVRNCTMNGDFVCASTAGTTKLWKIGGIAGTVEDGGSVENCIVNGQAQWGMASKGDGPSLSQGFWFGGAVGHLMSGTVANCKVNAASKGHDIRGKAGYNTYVGGVVGQVDADGIVSGCTNAQGIYYRVPSPTVAAGALARIGGIVGENLGTVTACACTIASTSSLSANDGHETLALGGVVGLNDGVITECTSTAKLSGPTQYNTTMFSYIGGIVGWTKKGLSNLSHDGEIAVAPAAANWGGTVGPLRVQGGVVGYAEDDIVLDKLTNNGIVNYTQTTKVYGAGAIVGGVVGFINGPVTLSNSVNNGDVYNCLFNNFLTPLNQATVTGGIVGVVYGGSDKNATVSSCVNNKELGCRRGLLGGITAWAKRVDVSGCENYGGTSAANYKGTVTESISHRLGGILAWADTAAVISGCKAENIKLCYKPKTATCYTGGIVSELLDATSKIIECTAKKITIEPQTQDSEDNCLRGGIAATSVADSWIHSCKFSVYYGVKGDDPVKYETWEICSDLNFDDDQNNEVIEDE